MSSSLHKLLTRQLNRTHLSFNALPDNLENWHDFLDRVNKSYGDNDQDRYLLSRSMEVSSKELQDLNEKLEQAQHIIHMGYWFHDSIAGRIIWSKSLFKILELDTFAPTPTFEEFMDLVHEQDREPLRQLIDKALTKEEGFRFELRIRLPSGTYKWFRTITTPFPKKGILEGVLMDISKDKEAEAKIMELNKQLLTTARRAGMSEIATSILHNIGNILNSATVSLNMLKESANQPFYFKLSKIAALIREEKHRLVDYLENDEKGRLIPDYIVTLSEILLDEMEKTRSELKNLDDHILHLRDIVASQQALSGVSGITEEINVQDVVESALKMTFNKDDIEIIRDYDSSALIKVDKTKLLQILINLIQNAKESAKKNKQSPAWIRIRLNADKKEITIAVEDNGIGIPPEQFNHIFSFGFTTKKGGHGFGLHSCALSAQLMGGNLSVDSKGVGQGATFTLKLPKIESPRKEMQ